MAVAGGKQVRLYLVGGSPQGLLTAEIMNWTGHVLAGRRSEIAELLRRAEVQRTGVYVLLGSDKDTGRVVAYIGEGDQVSTRLHMHQRPEPAGGKDFWDRVVVLTSKDANITKAHARYLESRLIGMALAAQRCTLVNGTTPPPTALPEADVADMEYFIGQALIILPLLGVNIFRAPILDTAGEADVAATPQAVEESPVFELSVPRHGVAARAQEVDGEFTVLAGSLGRARWASTAQKSGYAGLHATLLGDGTLVPARDGLVRFSRNTVFDSPSAAGAVVTGRSCNGRVSWVSATDRQTYGAWQSRGLDDAADS